MKSFRCAIVRLLVVTLLANLVGLSAGAYAEERDAHPQGLAASASPMNDVASGQSGTSGSSHACHAAHHFLAILSDSPSFVASVTVAPSPANVPAIARLHATVLHRPPRALA